MTAREREYGGSRARIWTPASKNMDARKRTYVRSRPGIEGLHDAQIPSGKRAGQRVNALGIQNIKMACETDSHNPFTHAILLLTPIGRQTAQGAFVCANPRDVKSCRQPHVIATGCRQGKTMPEYACGLAHPCRMSQDGTPPCPPRQGMQDPYVSIR